jgi:hypothetical protein
MTARADSRGPDRGQARRSTREEFVVIECERCSRNSQPCTDCVVGVLLGGESSTPVDTVGMVEEPYEDGIRVDDVQRRAIDALADQGMVPRLRMAPVEGSVPDTPDHRRRVERLVPSVERTRRAAG